MSSDLEYTPVHDVDEHDTARRSPASQEPATRRRASRGRKRTAVEEGGGGVGEADGDEDDSQADTRTKARDRQRRKRQRDRESASESPRAPLLPPIPALHELDHQHAPAHPPPSFGFHDQRNLMDMPLPLPLPPNHHAAPPRPAPVKRAKQVEADADLTPEELAKKERIRIAARERQRKHRAVVKAKRMAELGLTMGPDGTPGLANMYYDPHTVMHPHMSEDMAHSEFPIVQPNTSPGQTFASIVMLAFQCAPMLKQHLLRQLAMSNEDLGSLEPALAASFDQWNQERIQYAPPPADDQEAAEEQAYAQRHSNGSSHVHEHHMHSHSPYEGTPPMHPNMDMHDASTYHRQHYSASVRDVYPNHSHAAPGHLHPVVEASFVRGTRDEDADDETLSAEHPDHIDPNGSSER